MNGYPMSVVVEMTGLTARQIRYYEETGLVNPERSPGQHRRFSENDIAILQQIARLKEEGHSLQEARKILMGQMQTKSLLNRYSDAKQYFKR